ncbi:MAG: response regulator transcription factor [Actinomycetes bacterium]
MAMRVLVVEDDDRIRAVLRMALEDEGYDVAEAPSGESALTQLQARPADLMIVDLMLGELDGLTCIREVRRTRDLPIVIVSAHDDSHDIVAGLEAGADDYVTKPFQVKEITARIRALRRRVGRSEHTRGPADLVLDSSAGLPLVLSPEAGVLRRGNEPVHLTLTEFRLLCELADVPGKVLSRQALLDRVWDRGFFGDERLVDVHVRRLHTKIESDPARPRLVVTVRGLGYRLDPRG